jgi:hypothetical protein
MCRRHLIVIIVTSFGPIDTIVTQILSLPSSFCLQLDSQAAQHSAALEEAAVQKEKEVTALKTTYDSLDKIAAGLRTKLRYKQISKSVLGSYLG